MAVCFSHVEDTQYLTVLCPLTLPPMEQEGGDHWIPYSPLKTSCQEVLWRPNALPATELTWALAQTRR